VIKKDVITYIYAFDQLTLSLHFITFSFFFLIQISLVVEAFDIIRYPYDVI